MLGHSNKYFLSIMFDLSCFFFFTRTQHDRFFFFACDLDSLFYFFLLRLELTCEGRCLIQLDDSILTIFKEILSLSSTCGRHIFSYLFSCISLMYYINIYLELSLYYLRTIANCQILVHVIIVRLDKLRQIFFRRGELLFHSK